MSTKINNISGLDYNIDDEFNDKRFDQLVQFNGFPVNTDTYPTGANYIWSFYTGSNLEASDQSNTQTHLDLIQNYAINSAWEPQGWYTPSSSNQYLSNIGDIDQTVTVMNKLRHWQSVIRLGIGDEDANAERILGYIHSASTDPYAVPGQHSLIYNQAQNPEYNLPPGFSNPERGWVNGEAAVFPTKLDTSSNNFRTWIGVNQGGEVTAGSQGFAMGSNGLQVNYGSFLGIVRGTPSFGTGPAGAPHPYISPLQHATASIPTYTETESEKDRFIHSEHGLGSSGGYNKWGVLRTPQRVFNYHPDTGITRKFVGFFYHGHSIASNTWDNISNKQKYMTDAVNSNGIEINQNGYVATFWATQYNSTSFNRHTYTHPGTGNVYTNKLVHHAEIAGNHNVYLQPPPTFIGGIKRSDLGDFVTAPNFLDRYYTGFPDGYQSDWKSKILEIPDSAFDYEGLIRLRHDTNAIQENLGVSDQRTTGIYIYMVTPYLAAGETYSDIAICNLQIAEYDNALVPQFILDNYVPAVESS